MSLLVIILNGNGRCAGQEDYADDCEGNEARRPLCDGKEERSCGTWMGRQVMQHVKSELWCLPALIEEGRESEAEMKVPAATTHRDIARCSSVIVRKVCQE